MDNICPHLSSQSIEREISCVSVEVNILLKRILYSAILDQYKIQNIKFNAKANYPKNGIGIKPTKVKIGKMVPTVR